MSANIQEFDFSVNVLEALLWQYNVAPNLEGVMRLKQAWYDENQTEFWDDWITDVFDLRTANAFGLRVWSAILGIPLSIVIQPSPTNKPTWGFGQYFKNFSNGNFANVNSSNISITIDEQRRLLRLRYFQLTSRCTVTDINRILKIVFGDIGGAYVIDPLDMSPITYVFGFVPSSQFQLILEQFDILPRPAGIGIQYSIP